MISEKELTPEEADIDAYSGDIGLSLCGQAVTCNSRELGITGVCKDETLVVEVVIDVDPFLLHRNSIVVALYMICSWCKVIVLGLSL